MSLKLGNTNIAGTQVLYSTTGNNTDGAMTQAVTTTQLNLKANDTDVVHKIGNENIGGEKTFNDAVFTNIGFNRTFNITRGTAPSIVHQGEIAIGKDINGLGLGNFYYYHGTDNSNNVGIYCYDPTKSEGYINASIQIGYNGNGGVFTTAPACDNGNSIVTTINKSKAANGYFQFGNGLIINWGSYTYSDDSTHTITFPKAFSSTNYSISFGHQLKESNTCDFYGPQITNGTKSTTSCTVFTRNAGTARNANVMWLAIGY